MNFLPGQRSASPCNRHLTVRINCESLFRWLRTEYRRVCSRRQPDYFGEDSGRLIPRDRTVVECTIPPGSKAVDATKVGIFTQAACM